MIKKEDCRGCHDDVYNHQDFGMNKTPDGEFRCWSADSAVMVHRLDVHRDQPPPYDVTRTTERPSCYKMRGFIRVDPKNLTAKGYWK